MTKLSDIYARRDRIRKIRERAWARFMADETAKSDADSFKWFDVLPPETGPGIPCVSFTADWVDARAVNDTQSQAGSSIVGMALSRLFNGHG